MLKRLSGQESSLMFDWISDNGEHTILNVEVPRWHDGSFTDDQGFYWPDEHPYEFIHKKILVATTPKGVAGIVRTEPDEDDAAQHGARVHFQGYLDDSCNALENIYTAFASSCDLEIRESIAIAGMGMPPGRPPLVNVKAVQVSERLPNNVMRLMANDPDPLIRRCISTSQTVSYALFEMLANDENAENRAIAAFSERATAETLNKLSSDPDEYVRAHVASNPHTPPTALEALREDESVLVILGLASNPHTPSKTLHEIGKFNCGEVKRSVAGNPNTRPETLRKLLDEATAFAVSYHLAYEEYSRQHSYATESERDSHHDKYIQLAIAANPGTPLEMLEELVGITTDSQMLMMIAANPNATQQLVETIARTFKGDSGQETVAKEVHIGNHMLPIAYIEMMANSQDVKTRRLAKDCPWAPLAVKQRLSYDPELLDFEDLDWGVEDAVDVLEWEAEDWDLIGWDELPTEYYTGELGLDELEIKDGFARFLPDLEEPRSLLEILSLSISPSDRMEAACDPNTQTEVLERLGRDPYPYVRACVASNKYADESTLIRLSHDHDESVRMALASNDNLPTEVAAELMKEFGVSIPVKEKYGPYAPRTTYGLYASQPWNNSSVYLQVSDANVEVLESLAKMEMSAL